MIEPRDIKSFADLCLEKEDELHARNALRSLYYSLFHESRGVAFSRLKYTYTDIFSSHANLRNFYKARKSLQTKKIGNMLEDLYDLRCKADYDIGESIEMDEAKLARDIYDEAIKLLAKC